MVETDRLDIEKLNMQCDSMIEQLEEYNQKLDICKVHLQEFVNKDELQSEAYQDEKKRIIEHVSIIDALKIANEYDIKDCIRLKSVIGDMSIDGQEVISNMEMNLQRKTEYEQMADENIDKKNMSEDLFSKKFYSASIRFAVEQAQSYEKGYDYWKEKEKRFDEIVEETSNLFTESNGIRDGVKHSLDSLGVN